MCIGGMLALCTPLAASDATIDPPNTRHITLKKKQVENRAETPAAEQGQSTEANDQDENNNSSEAERHTGTVVVISGTALLLIIIILILLL